MRHIQALVVACIPSLCACVGVSDSQGQPKASRAQPSYTADGKLRRPEGIDNWVFVGASVGLDYQEKTANSDGPGKIHAVYIDPLAYSHYARTGEFREKALLALSIYEPSQKDKLAHQGFYSGDRSALEIALKDSERYAEGWA